MQTKTLMCRSISEIRVRFKASSEYFTDRSKALLLLWIVLLVMLHVDVCYAAVSVPCSLVVNG